MEKNKKGRKCVSLGLLSVVLYSVASEKDVLGVGSCHYLLEITLGTEVVIFQGDGDFLAKPVPIFFFLF